MEEQYFIGVDVGSASVRSAVFNKKGQRLGFSVLPIQQFKPKTDYVEQSATEIWTQVCLSVHTAVQQSAINPLHVKSIGFDATCSLVAVGADHESISVSPNGQPEHDIIMWMDHRAAAETTTINLTNDYALRYVGGEVSIEMELPKLLWLKNHFPERYNSVWRFFDLADFLVWKSTLADVASVCTLTCKWNYLAHETAFSQNLLADVGLDDLLTKIPQTILDLGKPAGYLTADVAEAFGLHTQVVVASGIIDAHAGGLALTAEQPEGSLAIISGTSNCHMIVSRDAVMVPGVWGPYLGAMLPGLWLNEGGQSAAGALVEWTLRQHESWPDILAESNAKGIHYYQLLNDAVAELRLTEPYPTARLHVLADHHGNRSPRANPDARGMVSGLTFESGLSALARYYLATLQSIAYGTRHIIDALEESGHQINRIVMCGGATKNPLWLHEYANVTGREIHLVQEEDAVNLGAALLGAVACSAFGHFSEAANAMVRDGDIIRPDTSSYAFHEAKYQVYLQMYQDQQNYNDAMSNF